MTQDSEARPGGGGATEQAQEVAGQAQEKTQQLAEEAQQRAQRLAEEAQERAQQLTDLAQRRLRSEVELRAKQAAQRMHQVANDLRSISLHLREDGREGPARMAEQAAQRARRLGSYLEESDPDRILSDVEETVRRRPWVVVAGGMTLGLAASRLLKTASGQRYEQGSAGERSPSSPGDTGAAARGELSGAVGS